MEKETLPKKSIKIESEAVGTRGTECGKKTLLGVTISITEMLLLGLLNKANLISAEIPCNDYAISARADATALLLLNLEKFFKSV